MGHHCRLLNVDPIKRDFANYFLTGFDHKMFQYVTICDMHKNEYDIYNYNVYIRMTDLERNKSRTKVYKALNAIL